MAKRRRLKLLVSTVLASFSLIFCSLSFGQSIIRNGGFENGMNSWLNENDLNVAQFSTDCQQAFSGNCSARVDVSNAVNVHQVQLKQNFAVQQNVAYALVFSAKASRNRTIEVEANQDHDPWNQVSFYNVINLTTSWQTFHYNFFGALNDNLYKLTFHVGNDVSTVWVDDVSITQQILPLPDGSLVFNRDFEEGTLDFWNTENYVQAGRFSKDCAVAASGRCSAKIEVLSVTDCWQVQLKQAFPLELQRRYRISFSAKSTANRVITLDVHRDYSPWGNSQIYQQVNITSQWQSFEYTFTGQVNDSRYRAAFHVGNNLNTVWIDNVFLRYDIVQPPPNQAPTVSITSGPNGNINQNSATFTFSGTDADGQIAGYYYGLDNANPNTFTNANSFTWSNLSAGQHTFYIKSVDNSNAFSAIVNRTFTYVIPPPPNQVPTVSITSGPNGVINQNSATFTFNGIDSDGLVTGYYYGLDLPNPNTFTVNNQFIWSNLIAGQHTFYVLAQDDDGASSAIVSRTFTYIVQPPPNQAPTVLITSGPMDIINHNSATFIFEGWDPDGIIVGFYYDLDNPNPSNWNTTGSVGFSNLSIGQHIFYVKAVDDGNAFSAIVSLVFSYQAQAPPPPDRPVVNMLRNPSFEVNGGLESWLSENHQNTAQFFRDCNNVASHGSCSARIENSRIVEVYNVQLKQIIPMEQREYKGSFSAKSSSNRPITLDIHRDYSPWGDSQIYQQYNLTTQWQTFEFSFTGRLTDDHFRITFHIGDNTPAVWLDNIVLGYRNGDAPNRPVNQPPQANILSGPSGTINQNFANFTFSGSDPDGQVIYYMIGLDDPLNLNIYNNSGMYTWGNLGTGERTFFIKAYDDLGDASPLVYRTFIYQIHQDPQAQNPLAQDPPAQNNPPQPVIEEDDTVAVVSTGTLRIASANDNDNNAIYAIALVIPNRNPIPKAYFERYASANNPIVGNVSRENHFPEGFYYVTTQNGWVLASYDTSKAPHSIGSGLWNKYKVLASASFNANDNVFGWHRYLPVSGEQSGIPSAISGSFNQYFKLQNINTDQIASIVHYSSPWSNYYGQSFGVRGKPWEFWRNFGYGSSGFGLPISDGDSNIATFENGQVEYFNDFEFAVHMGGELIASGGGNAVEPFGGFFDQCEGILIDTIEDFGNNVNTVFLNDNASAIQRGIALGLITLDIVPVGRAARIGARTTPVMLRQAMERMPISIRRAMGGVGRIKSFGKILVNEEVRTIANNLTSRGGVRLSLDKAKNILITHSPFRFREGSPSNFFPLNWNEQEILTTVKSVADQCDRVGLCRRTVRGIIVEVRIEIDNGVRYIQNAWPVY